MGIAIVGSRRCTDYGKRITVDAAEFLAKNNIPIISGMAKGIDGYAHTACLKAGGYTVAILGCGIDICYPKEHIELMQRIIERWFKSTRKNYTYRDRRESNVSR